RNVKCIGQRVFGCLHHGIHNSLSTSRVCFLIMTLIDSFLPVLSHRKTNKTWKNNMYETQTIIFLVLISVEITMPVTISVASLLLLLLSLWRHI
ncbi:hypothetical protein HPG69_004169, partial [Diceros bicornis minor]